MKSDEKKVLKYTWLNLAPPTVNVYSRRSLVYCRRAEFTVRGAKFTVGEAPKQGHGTPQMVLGTIFWGAFILSVSN